MDSNEIKAFAPGQQVRLLVDISKKVVNPAVVKMTEYSVHDRIKPPVGTKKEHRSDVWIQGEGDAVRLLEGEYRFVASNDLK